METSADCQPAQRTKAGHMIKITKFGGSSVADAGQFKKVKRIIEADEGRRFVVVSAAGKRSSDDNKITDLLYLVDAHRTYHVDCTPLLEGQTALGYEDGLPRFARLKKVFAK